MACDYVTYTDGLWSHGIRYFIICLEYEGHFITDYFDNCVLHRSNVKVNLANGEVECFRYGRVPPWRVTLADTGDETQMGGPLQRIGHPLAQDQPSA